MIGHFGRFRLDETGATATEMALVLVVFIVLIVGMIEFAVAYMTLHTMRLALEEAGRYVMVYHANITAPQAASAICTVLTGSSSGCSTPPAGQSCSTTAGQFCVNATQSNANNTMTLSATYGFDFIGITGSSLPLGGQVTVPLY
jgi:Flp pilus assembly protein TadG